MLIPIFVVALAGAGLMWFAYELPRWFVVRVAAAYPQKTLFFGKPAKPMVFLADRRTCPTTAQNVSRISFVLLYLSCFCLQ